MTKFYSVSHADKQKTNEMNWTRSTQRAKTVDDNQGDPLEFESVMDDLIAEH